MRLVVTDGAREALRDRGAVYVWPRAFRCCGGRQHTLEASFEQPPGDFEPVHSAAGLQVHASRGLRLPQELHLDLDRRGRPRAYWNGQAWIG